MQGSLQAIEETPIYSLLYESWVAFFTGKFRNHSILAINEAQGLTIDDEVLVRIIKFSSKSSPLL